MGLSGMEADRLLREAYPYRIELHAHTSNASSCSEIPPEELVETYAKLGVSAVCITNHLPYGFEENVHRCISDYYAAKAAGEKLGIQVILGIELRFPENANDYLLFGITPEDLLEIKDMLGMDFASFSRVYRSKERFLCQAHPYRNQMVPIDPVLLDGIEAFNMHPNHNSRVGVATRNAKAAGTILTAGTDYHHPTHEALGLTRTCTLPKDSFELAAILKSGDFLFEIGGSIVLP